MRLSALRPILAALFLLLPALAHGDGATLYVSPSYGTYQVGDTFKMQILADSGGQPINAAEADLVFNPQILQVVGVSTDGSILSTWPTPPHFSNVEGTVGFSGVADQDFTGTGGLLITVTFKALADMESDARLAAGAILAANDTESNIITSMKSAVFNIQPSEGNPDVLTPEAAQQAGAGDSSSDRSSTGGGVQSDASTSGGISDASAGSGQPVPSTAASVPPPVLAGYQNEIPVGDRIIVSGTSTPNSTVSVYLQVGNDAPQRTDMDTAGDGSFTFVSDTETQSGVYHLWAIALGPDGMQSDPSNVAVISANPPTTAAAAIFATNLLSDILPFFALLIVGGLGAGYLFHRHKIEKLRLQKDAHVQ